MTAHIIMTACKWAAILIPAALLVLTALAIVARAKQLEAAGRQFGDFTPSQSGSSHRMPTTPSLVHSLRKPLAVATAGLALAIVLAEAGISLFPGVL